jgi:hypothetical protein
VGNLAELGFKNGSWQRILVPSSPLETRGRIEAEPGWLGLDTAVLEDHLSLEGPVDLTDPKSQNYPL